MATSAMTERDVVLSAMPCDPRKVEAILADWGLDEATINRMLSEEKAGEASMLDSKGSAHGIKPRTHDATVSDRRGAGLRH